MLAPHQDRVAVVELDSGLPVMSDVDVILYDTFGQVQGDGVDLEDLVRDSGARVVIFSWNLQPDLVAAGDRARARPATCRRGSAPRRSSRRSRRCTPARSSYPPSRTPSTAAPG